MPAIINNLKTGMIVNSWNQYLTLFPNNGDVYFTEEYARLYENEDDKAECFIYKEGNKVFLFPYLKRRVDIIDKDYFDFETPYGYGGPISNTTASGFNQRAVAAFDSSAKENGIIAGLVRFHPLLDNYKLLQGRYDVVFDRKTVAMDLNLTQDVIWRQQIHPKHRNVIIKAQKSGLIYQVDAEMKYLDIFKDLYLSTMERIGADRYYFFNDAYFHNIKRNLSGHAFLGLVFFEDIIIAGALFFKYGRYGHYHLAGSLEKYRQYYPNNFLIYNAALYLKEKGISLFHIGGGSDGDPKNNLFNFKKRFSNDEYFYYICKLILDEEAYKEVCSIWAKRFPEKKEKYSNFILKYRY